MEAPWTAQDLESCDVPMAEKRFLCDVFVSFEVLIPGRIFEVLPWSWETVKNPVQSKWYLLH